MRRLPLVSAIATILLSGCFSQNAISGLSAQQVIEKSVRANAQTQNVHISMNAEYDVAGSIKEKGELLLSGNAVAGFQSFSGSGNITRHIQTQTTARSLFAAFDIASASSTEWYARVRTLDFEPKNSAVSSDGIVQTWWKMADTDEAKQILALQTPDPSAINAILASVIVDRDDGLVTDNRRKMYHYHVHIDAGAPGANSMGLASLPSGELWIDAQTYLLQRAIWNIRNIPGTNGSTDANMDIRLSRHNEQLPVSVPLTYEYATADVWRMFHTILPSALLPE
mgnify:CR=1 FL=1